MKKKLLSVCAASMASVYLTQASAGEFLGHSDAQVNIVPDAGTTFTVSDRFVWSWSAGIYQPGTNCTASFTPLDTDAMFDPEHANTDTNAGPHISGRSIVSMGYSGFLSTIPLNTPLYGINWKGYWDGFDRATLWDGNGDPIADDCNSALAIALGTYGAHVNFTADGPFSVSINAPVVAASNNQSTASPQGRRVDANILCLDDGPVSSSILSQNGFETTTPMPSNPSLVAGSYTFSYIMNLSIEDAYHDVTSDGRFNQDDVDFLNNSVVGTALASAQNHVDRFDFNLNGIVDSDDVAMLQCFVDACLDARRIGDGNCDNTIDCDDLIAFGNQPFTGENTYANDYNVGFDSDLDGDNDLDDKEIIFELLLKVEPADFSMNGQLNDDDFFAFLNLLFDKNQLADLNEDGIFSEKDLDMFYYLRDNPLCL